MTISHTTQTYSLRGIGESDPIQEPVLAVYVDDVYVPRQIGSMVEFNDLERIEVLRGPQGTLYGRNSSAGALRIITRDPGDTFRAKGEVGLGNYGAVDVRALVEGPLANDLSGSLSYIHHSRDGVTYDPTLGHDVNRIDLDSYRGKLRWTPTPASTRSSPSTPCAIAATAASISPCVNPAVGSTSRRPTRRSSRSRTWIRSPVRCA